VEARKEVRVHFEQDGIGTTRWGVEGIKKIHNAEREAQSRIKADQFRQEQKVGGFPGTESISSVRHN